MVFEYLELTEEEIFLKLLGFAAKLIEQKQHADSKGGKIQTDLNRHFVQSSSGILQIKKVVAIDSNFGYGC